jgi:hypothetical protein
VESSVKDFNTRLNEVLKYATDDHSPLFRSAIEHRYKNKESYGPDKSHSIPESVFADHLAEQGDELGEKFYRIAAGRGNAYAVRTGGGSLALEELWTAHTPEAYWVAGEYSQPPLSHDDKPVDPSLTHFLQRVDKKVDSKSLEMYNHRNEYTGSYNAGVRIPVTADELEEFADRLNVGKEAQ